MMDSSLSSTIKAIGTAWALLFLTCCRHLPQGHFEGNLQTKSPTHHTVELVGIDVRRVAPRLKLIEVKNSQSKVLSQILVTKVSYKKFLLNISQIRKDPFLLTKSEARDQLHGDACYSSAGEWYIQFCYSEDQFYFKARSPLTATEHLLFGSLTAPKGMAVHGDFSLEDPIDLSLDEGVKRALDFSFESREGFEKAYQAKLEATKAYLNLLPHLTVGILWYVSPSPTSAVTGLFSFFPFLLPSAWLDAKKASIDSKVQLKAMKILRADLIVTIESLFYEFARTEKIQTISRQFLEKLERFESGGGVRIGQLAKLEAFGKIRENLKNSIEYSNWILEQNRFALSRALGFHNPIAVKKLRLGDSAYSEIPSEIDRETLGQGALRRSIELSQLDLVLRSETTRKTWLYFNWLNPNGDSQAPLGFSLFTHAKLIEARTNEILLQQDELKTRIFNRSYEVALNHNRAIQLYLTTVKKAKTSEEQFMRLMGKADEEQFSDDYLQKMAGHLQDWITASLESEDHLRNLRIEKARANRLLLSGHYASLLF